jgi:POT family proton-dependent oligopeptide transporter
MNLYTDTKTDRMLFGFNSYVSKSECRIYYSFATGVAGFWAKRKLKIKASSILKWQWVLL